MTSRMSAFSKLRTIESSPTPASAIGGGRGSLLGRCTVGGGAVLSVGNGAVILGDEAAGKQDQEPYQGGGEARAICTAGAAAPRARTPITRSVTHHAPLPAPPCSRDGGVF